jgi:hypothetical protein
MHLRLLTVELGTYNQSNTENQSGNARQENILGCEVVAAGIALFGRPDHEESTINFKASIKLEHCGHLD